MFLLGYDVGTSSVKVSLVDSYTGKCLGSAFWPESESRIISVQTGWAEQEPNVWWDNLKFATRKLFASLSVDSHEVGAIGISYQMHGLVCVDEHRDVLRNSIIWCDSRAVSYGNDAFDSIGHENCLSTMLNSPGNFTASKLAWVKNNEPEIYSRIYKIMLPGDYIAMKLSGGDITTTVSGLSEGVLWDFSKNELSSLLMDYYGFNESIIADIVPTFGMQTVVCEGVALELGLKPGVPITYRAGDQPNNALSLKVLNPGEVAATGGTSGVVYGVLGCVNHDPMSRVNSFAHVNHHKDNPRLGVLLCINGTGILNAWMRRMIAPDGYSYSEMNGMAASVPVGCDGLTILPFGNGSERILCNNNVGCSIDGLNFNNHTKAHLLRAAQEGIVYSFRYGIEIMENMGLDIRNIHAGYANMFLSPLFSEALANVTGATISLFDTDGSVGAARGAGIGLGIYKDMDEAFSALKCLATIEPDTKMQQAYTDAYYVWKERLETKIK